MSTRDLLAEQQSQADQLKAEIEGLKQQVWAKEIRRDTLLGSIEQLRVLVHEAEDDLTGVVVDFTGCANTVERLTRIAQAAPHKVLNTTKVTHYLLARGQSQASFKNYRTEINWAFNRRPGLFEKVRAGTYRYREVEPAPREGLEGPPVDYYEPAAG